MADANIPDDLLLDVLAVFRAGERRNDPVVAAAMFQFLCRVEADAIAPAQVRQFLGNETVVSGYVETVRADLDNRARGLKADLSSTRDDVLEAIRTNTSQTLSVQQQMHSDVQRLNIAAERLEHASRQSVADAKALSGMISAVMRNTSTRSAFAIGLAVGVLAGIPVNLGTSAVYERWLSIEAWNGKKPEEGAAAAPPAPLPELVQPWPPVPTDNSNDIVTWFRRNDSFTFRPVPPVSSRPLTPAAETHPVIRQGHRPQR